MTAARKAGSSMRVFKSNVVKKGSTALADLCAEFLCDRVCVSTRFDWVIGENICPAAFPRIMIGEQINARGKITSQISNPEINQNKLEYKVSESFCIAIAVPHTGCPSANFLKEALVWLRLPS
jgi:hypothetical protein